MEFNMHPTCNFSQVPSDISDAYLDCGDAIWELMEDSSRRLGVGRQIKPLVNEQGHPLGEPKCYRLRAFLEANGPPCSLNPTPDTEVFYSSKGDARQLDWRGRSTVVEVSQPSQDREVFADYNEATREYVVHIPERVEPIVLPQDEAEQMISDYSKHAGKGHTIKQVALAYGYTEREVRGILRAMEWTHAHEPFTKETMSELSEEELVDNWMAKKRRAVTLKVQEKSWREVKRAAKKWWEFEHAVVAQVDKVAEKFAQEYSPSNPCNTCSLPEGDDYALVYLPTDLHYGKYGWAGFGPGAYDRDTCISRLEEATQKVLKDLPSKPEKIIMPVGSDWCHIDTESGTTTRGTPQDMDGVPEEIVEQSMWLAVRTVENLIDVAPVECVFMGGNHDWMWSVAAFTALKIRFSNDPRVTFTGVSEPYQWMTYGSTLIGLHHGHGKHKAKDLALLMANHASEQWGRVEHRYFFTGNLHHYNAAEEGGIISFLSPSLAGADRWHSLNGYTMATPALHAYMIDKEDGWRMTFRASFPEGKER